MGSPHFPLRATSSGRSQTEYEPANHREAAANENGSADGLAARCLCWSSAGCPAEANGL